MRKKIVSNNSVIYTGIEQFFFNLVFFSNITLLFTLYEACDATTDQKGASELVRYSSRRLEADACVANVDIHYTFGW